MNTQTALLDAIYAIRGIRLDGWDELTTISSGMTTSAGEQRCGSWAPPTGKLWYCPFLGIEHTATPASGVEVVFGIRTPTDATIAIHSPPLKMLQTDIFAYGINRPFVIPTGTHIRLLKNIPTGATLVVNLSYLELDESDSLFSP